MDELLLQRTRSEETMQIGTEKLCDKVNVLKRRDEDVTEGDDLILSACFLLLREGKVQSLHQATYVFMAQVL